jgi:DNA-binding GntR family transcriptional regulator
VSASPHTLGTAQQYAVEALRRLIVAGALRPGQRVNQEDIAEQVGLSLAPVREALRALEQEGQVVYRPRRGYFITELRVEDLQEIYALRKLLEGQAVRHALPALGDEAVERIARAADECADAAQRGDVAAELAANRRFHFGMLESPDQTHTMRLIRLLWDSTEAYRAMYYNSAEERETTVKAHAEILDAVRRRAVDEVVARLDEARIANARANDMHEVWKHPQLKARNRWREVGTARGTIPALLPPGSWEEGDPRMDPVPALGEHTDRILSGLGYTPDQISRLRAGKVI